MGPDRKVTKPIQAGPTHSTRYADARPPVLDGAPRRAAHHPLHIRESPVESTAHHTLPPSPAHPHFSSSFVQRPPEPPGHLSVRRVRAYIQGRSIGRRGSGASPSVGPYVHSKVPRGLVYTAVRERGRERERERDTEIAMIMRRSSGAAAWVLGVAVAAAAFFLAAEAAGAAPVPHDYEQALRKSLLYFEAQRSGRLPYGQRVSWRDHSGLTDGLEQGVDLVGGYYDAGDHVKFGLPMAFTVTMLSWSLLEYGGDVAAAGELAHALESIKWGTDYFIKAHTKPDELWAEVGDGDTDHYCWQRPEDMTTSRQAYKVDRERPGSDVAGETAAALAAASMAFRETNPHYAHLLLHHAQQLFEFADKYRGKYDSSIAEVKSYYASVSGYHDELLWAALWLHRATGRASYLDYVVDNAHEFGGTGWAITEFSWDVKYAGVQILATRLLLRGEHEERHRATLEGYRAKAEHYVCACMGKNAAAEDNVERSPGGMLYVRQWNNMQYVTSAAFLLSVYSGYLTEAGEGATPGTVTCAGASAGAGEVFAHARAQVDYVLGSNPRGISYLVGYGAKFPARVHHRAASIVPYKDRKEFIGCAQGFDDWFGRKSANPNVVVGAIVGGPDRHDRFRDDRVNYMQTEACTYNTAPMVGMFAMLNRVAREQDPSPASSRSTAAE